MYHFKEYLDKLFDAILEQAETFGKKALDVICIVILLYYILAFIG